MNDGPLSNLVKHSTLFCLTVMLAGCFSDGPGDLFDDYQTKIARIQDTDEIKEE
nr:DUF3080 domain-containing protein [Vibrio lentus]